MEPPVHPSLVEHIGRRRGVTVALWCIAALLALLLFGPATHARAPLSAALPLVTIDTAGLADASAPVELSYSETIVDDADGDAGAEGLQRHAGFAAAVAPNRHDVIARYGPFRIVGPTTAEMIGTVDSDSPAAFAAMLRAHPALARLVMVDCPGSIDEAANLALARMVRRAGIATHVPDGGSVRSGAVELWLAGARRSADSGAEFGVHSWRDEDGREARDYAAGDPVHGEYLRFYREMGIGDGVAQRFYALTNSVGFDDLRILSTADMRQLGLLSTIDG